LKAPEGIRILDLAHIVAGLFGSLLLADDPRHSLHVMRTDFLALNRTKAA